MAYKLMQALPYQREDANGNPLTSGTIEFYINGTSTPSPVYFDIAGSTFATSVTLNSLGEPSNGGNPVSLFQDDDVVLKAIIKDSTGATLRTITDIYAPANASDSLDLANTSDAAKGDALVGTKRILSGAVAQTVHSWIESRVPDVKSFGAVGDGVTDDTAAIQAALDACLSTTGGGLYFPDGTYLISSALTIGLKAGWKIYGESRLGVIIKQNTDNTAIFRFTKENAHSWSMSSMSLTWTNAQPSTNTAAIGLYFDFDAQTGSGAYLWGAYDIAFDNGYLCMATNNGAANLVWGMTLDRISTGTAVSGGLIRFDPNPNAGQPSIKIGTVYIRADAMTLPAVFLAACNGCVIDNFEINNAQNIVALKLEGGSTVEIKEFKVENCDYTAADSHIIDYTDSDVRIGTFVLGNTTFTLGASNKAYCFRKTGAGAAGISVGDFSAQGNTLTSGELYVFSTSSDTTPNRIERVRGIDIAYLTDVASSAGADNTWVEQWGKNRISTDNGDADLTMAVGDETTQMFTTTLTANRVVTLPPGHAANPSNLFNGLRYKIVRNNATPGAFTLTVNNSAGTTIKQIPNSTNAVVEVTYRRGGWVLTGYTVL